MAFRMADTGRKNVSVKVVAAVPGSWASHASVVTAPRLLVCRPSKVPVRVAFMAIVSKVVLLVLINDLWRQVDVVVLINDVRRGRYWHRHVVIVSRLHHWHMNHFVDNMGLLDTSSAMQFAALLLVRLSPQLLPVIVISFAIQFGSICSRRRRWPKIPQKQASVCNI